MLLYRSNNDKIEFLLLIGPTLAELNANDENLLGDLNFDDLLLPSDVSYTILESTPGHYTFANNLSNNNQLVGASSSCPQGKLPKDNYQK